MFETRHYVPILKWKQGEYQALRESTSITKGYITPLIEIVPIPWDYENERQKTSATGHVSKVADQIEECWGKAPIFVDVEAIDADELLDGGLPPLEYVFDKARGLNLFLVPVTSLDRSPAYQTSVAKVVATDRHGVCIRLQDGDFDDLTGTGAEIDNLLALLEVEPEDVDIVLDFGEVNGSQTTALVLASRGIINSLPRVNQWRTMTLSSGAFPQNLTGVAAQSVQQIGRSDWLLWRTLVGSPSQLTRVPSFGDYAIANPVLADLDPRIVKMSANIRYTHDVEWHIFKGRNTRDHGFGQFRQLSADLIALSIYSGPPFSWGDNFIDECAKGVSGTGNGMTWRKVGTNHHLAFVVDQIANVPGI